MSRKYLAAMAAVGILCSGLGVAAEDLEFKDSLATITVDEDTKIYEEASEGSKGVAYLMAGDSVQQIGVADGWSKIVYQDQICYMPLDGMTATEATKETEAQKTEESAQQETEAAEESEQTTDVEGASTDTGELSDDIYSFQFSFNGTVFQMPEKYTDFVEKGWADLGNKETVDANTYTSGIENFMMGNSKIWADIVNFDWNPAKLEDCYISSVKFDLSSLDPSDEIILPGGFKVDQNMTEEKVKEAYGEPTELSESEYGNTLYYKITTYENVTFKFPTSEYSSMSVEVQNMVQPEDFAKTEASTETPDIVSLYKAPSSLSESLWDYTVEFGGDLYTLPCPVTELEKNGWEISGDAETVAGGDYGRIDVRRDNQNARFQIKNYAETATTVENCFVQSIRGEKDGETLIITGGIQAGMEEAEVLKALDGVEYEIYESGDFKSYTIKNPGASSLYNKYSINTSEGEVKSVEVEHMVNEKELEAFYTSR